MSRKGTMVMFILITGGTGGMKERREGGEERELEVKSDSLEKAEQIY